MKRTPAEEVLGEWGPRGGTVEWQREGAALALERDGLVGQPLARRLRSPFGVSTDLYARAVGGLPAHIRRLRKIEDETEAHLERLALAYESLASECAGDEARFVRGWRSLAASWSFDELNELIERHNRWYPAEARLPMDPRTGDFVPVGGRPYRRAPVDGEWVLRRFPPSLPAPVAA